MPLHTSQTVISVLQSPDIDSARHRFWVKVDTSGECWLWLASTCGQGYGQFFVRKGIGAKGVRPFNALAHRAAWELTNGQIPDGLTIDHICRNRICVNPAHMEIVTLRENIGRAEHWNRTKTSCPNGHEYDRVDTWVDSAGVTNYARRCDRCRKQQERERRRLARG